MGVGHLKEYLKKFPRGDRTQTTYRLPQLDKELRKAGGVPRGIFCKYIPLAPLQHLGMTIRLEGMVAA